MKIGILCAMQCEADAVLAHMRISGRPTAVKPCYEGKLFGDDALLAVTGIGKVNAALTAQLLLDTYRPDLLVNPGLAGSLDPTLALYSVALCGKAAQYDFDLSGINHCPAGLLEEFSDVYLETSFRFPPTCPLPIARLATGDRFTDDPAEAEMLRGMGAQLRDMEGGAIFQAGCFSRVPVLAVKCVSDFVGEHATAGYAKNKDRALQSLEKAIPLLWEDIIHG